MNSDLFERRPVIVVVVLTLLFFWKLVFSTQFTFLDLPDQVFQVLPWYQVQAKAWNEGVFPMWDPAHWTGQSLLGQMQPGGAFPLNWPLFLAPLDDGHIDLAWIHLHFVLMHLLAALFMYGLIRQLGRGRYAAVLAGVAFACSGYVASTAWPQMMHGAIWIPLIFLFFHRVFDSAEVRDRLANAVLCGGVIGMALLSGHHQTPFYSLLALSVLFLYVLAGRFRESPPAAAKFTGLFGLIAVVSFCVAALQLIPALEYGYLSYRWVGLDDPVTMGQEVPYYAHTKLRLLGASLLGAFVPTAHFQVSTFTGFVCLTLAVRALLRCWRERWARVYAALAVGALAFCFGPLSLLHGWIYAFIPIADKARYASHGVFVFQFAVIILAAHGADGLLGVLPGNRLGGRDARETDWSWVAPVQKVLVGFAGVAWVILFVQYSFARMEGKSSDQVMIASLVALVLAALLEAGRRGAMKTPGLRVAFVLLMVFEMSVAHSIALTHREDPIRPGFLDKLLELSDVAKFLKSQPGPFRFEISAEEGQPNLAGWEGLEMVDGFLASVNRDIHDFLIPDWHKRRLMLNMVYTVAREKTRDTQLEVYSDASGWKVFRNPDAYPRAWTLRDLTALDDPRGPRAAPLEGDPCEGDAQIAFERSTLHSVETTIEAPCAMYVVFSDPYFPGWETELDGEPATLYRAYHALRAVVVPAGKHSVSFYYRPWTVYLGGALTTLGLLGCLLAGWFAWRRSAAA